MSNACAALVDDGLIRGVLATVECQTRAYAQGGYLALTTGSSVFQTALTALLVIYVALIGYRMLFAQGSVRLSDAPAIALKVGLIMALVTSWSTFQTLVFDTAARAPVEIAGLVAGPMQGADQAGLAASPIDGLQAAYTEFSVTAAAYGKLAGPDAKGYSSPQAAAAEATAAASGAIFLTSAGVISAATLSIGVLTAVGPLFIVLALIPMTRGLFVGWLRALVASALVPMVAWLLVVLMLIVLDPWVAILTEQRMGQRLEPQTAMSAAALVFVFAAGQAALVIGACVMAFGFKLPSPTVDRGVRAGESGRIAQAAGAGLAPLPSRAERLAMDLQRDQAQATAARTRSASTAAAASAAASARTSRHVSVGLDETRRLGDAYRRPAFTARRAGAAR
ncbi:MAG: type VI secretion protein [Phenylobacterium sp.]|uniref:type IV secretion system protein n=1 Tax=Phenylobacterium sp. TaxID=1871053 RepID=UPI001228129A|nr:type IV secretion system protein [Phenylobacterium sp.]TAJ70640.1 MAG: type VI secretion protein [Phenylobacterium sp.]